MTTTFTDHLRHPPESPGLEIPFIVADCFPRDLIPALMLMQLLAWNGDWPGISWTQVPVVHRTGERWLVVTAETWYRAWRLTSHQAHRGMKQLRTRDVVEVRTWQLDGTPKLHVRLLQDAILGMLDHRLAHPLPARNNEPVPDEVRQQVYERDEFCCTYCGSPGPLSIDHKVPRSQGGTNDLDNLQTACLLCNISKGDRSDISAHRRATITPRPAVLS